jgi:hypothetical protein
MAKFAYRKHHHAVKKSGTVYTFVRASSGRKRRSGCRPSIFLVWVILPGLLLSWLCALPSAVAVLDFLSRAKYHFCHVVSAPFRLIGDFYNLIPTPFVQSDSSHDCASPVTFERPIALVEQKISDVRALIAQLRNISASQQRLLAALQQLSGDLDALLAKDLSADLADPQKIESVYSEARVATALKKLVSDFCANHSTAREIAVTETREKDGHFSFKSAGAGQSFHLQKITFGPAAVAVTIRIGLRLKGKEVFAPGNHKLSATSETELQINPPQLFDEVEMHIVEGEMNVAIPDLKMFEPLRLIV